MNKWSQLGFGLGDFAYCFALHIVLLRHTNVLKDFVIQPSLWELQSGHELLEKSEKMVTPWKWVERFGWFFRSAHRLIKTNNCTKGFCNSVIFDWVTERTRKCGQTDRQTDGRTDVQTDGRTDGQLIQNQNVSPLMWGRHNYYNCFFAETT